MSLPTKSLFDTEGSLLWTNKISNFTKCIQSTSKSFLLASACFWHQLLTFNNKILINLQDRLSLLEEKSKSLFLKSISFPELEPIQLVIFVLWRIYKKKSCANTVKYG